MVVGKSNQAEFSPLFLKNEPLEFVNTYKYLGVELDAGKYNWLFGCQCTTIFSPGNQCDFIQQSKTD